MLWLKRRIRSLFYSGWMALLRRGFQSHSPQPFKLAILKLDRLGDATLSLGAVRHLLTRFAEAETLLIVSSIAAPLFRREFPAATLCVLPAFCERFWPDLVTTLARHAAQLGRYQTDVLVCLRHQPSDYLHAVAQLVQAEQILAASWNRPQEHTSLSFARVRRIPYPDAAPKTCLELEAHRRLVEKVLGQSVTLSQVLPTLSYDGSFGGAGLLVCPVTGDAIREYPAELLAHAVRLFRHQRPGGRVRLCLPPGSLRQDWQQVLETVLGGELEVVRPQSIDGLIEVIAQADLVLAPDSAPAHLATALDRPGVFLLGGGHFGMFAPWQKSPRQIWLNHPMACAQCEWRCCQPEAFCLTRLRPEDIAQNLLSVAAGTVDQARG